MNAESSVTNAMRTAARDPALPIYSAAEGGQKQVPKKGGDEGGEREGRGPAEARQEGRGAQGRDGRPDRRDRRGAGRERRRVREELRPARRRVVAAPPGGGSGIAFPGFGSGRDEGTTGRASRSSSQIDYPHLAFDLDRYGQSRAPERSARHDGARVQVRRRRDRGGRSARHRGPARRLARRRRRSTPPTTTR